MYKFIKKGFQFLRNKYYLYSQNWNLSRLTKTKLKNPEVYLNSIYFGSELTNNSIMEVESLDGLRIRGSRLDLTIVSEVWVLNEYQLDPAYEIKKGDIVFDVGAHIGIFSVQAASKGAKVYAFEPDKNNYKKLLDNIVLNNFQDRITTFNKGIYFKNTKVPFKVSDNNSGGNSIIRGIEEGTQEFIETVTLSEICDQQGVKAIDFVKMDIEGAEFPIWENISPADAKLIKKIVGEYHLFPFKPNWTFSYLKQLLKPYFSEIKRRKPYYFYAKK